MREKSDFDLLAEEGMQDGLLLLFLPGEQNGLARVVPHLDSAGFRGAEVLRRQLLQIDERERESVRERRAELLHEIEGEAVASGTQRMEEADLRVKPHSFQRPSTVMCEDRVEKRQECVHRVERRPPIAVLNGEGVTLCDEK